MSIALGGNSASKIYLGSTEVSKAYLGSDLVWGGQPSVPNYLRFKALEPSTIKVQSTLSAFPNLSYSTDATTWNTFDSSTTISLATGNVVYVKGVNNATATATSRYTQFVMTGTIEAHGNVMSLLYGDEFEGKLTVPVNYCFYRLFDSCESLVTAPELPATTLTTYCYTYMFRYCANLTVCPELPATNLANRCYANMFGYSGVVASPVLPATTLAEYCYSSMFGHCDSFTTPPELPVTSLQTGCYSAMFSNCTSLTTAPVLPATTLVSQCYTQMFDNCSSLNYVKAMFTTTPSTSYTRYWMRGVSASGTFVKNASAGWNVSGDNGIPSGWTVQTASS